MYKVLLVDQDAEVRSAMKYMISWEKENCQVIATAKDGEEAWNLYHQCHPDIICMDIELSKLDGITLIKRIKEDNEHTQIIVISNHSDFDSVRNAMKAGAFDYLLKNTVKKEELLDILEQMKYHLKEAVEVSSQLDQQSIVKLQQCMILKKNDHAIKEEEFLDVLKSDTFLPFQEKLQLAYFRIDNINLIYQSQFVDHDLLHRDLEDTIKMSITPSIPYQVIFISNHSGVILFGTRDKNKIVTICDMIIMSVKEHMHLQMSITLSHRMQNLNEFYSVYQSLLELHEIRFYVGEGVLIEAEELQNFNLLNYDDMNYHMRIIDSIRKREFTGIAALQEEALIYMKEHFIKPEQVRAFFIFIINNIEGNEIEKGVKNTFSFDAMLETIKNCETVDKLDQILREAFCSIEQWLLDTQQNRYRQDIIDILAFIDENYTQKMNLKMIADNFNINESYLSRMFKNETGKNLIYYINEKKMQRALELLSDPKNMVKEAAYAVGIEDQFYFNKVFKKFYGISPSEFRRKLKQKEEQIIT